MHILMTVKPTDQTAFEFFVNCVGNSTAGRQPLSEADSLLTAISGKQKETLVAWIESIKADKNLGRRSRTFTAYFLPHREAPGRP